MHSDRLSSTIRITAMSLNVVTIDSPTLLAVDVESVKTFLREWEEYRRKISERNSQLGDNDKIAEESLKSCIDSKVLSFICTFEISILGKTPETILDEELKDYLELICPQKVLVSGAEDVEQLLKKELRDCQKSIRSSKIAIGLTDEIKRLWTHLYAVLEMFNLLKTFEEKHSIKKLQKILLEVIGLKSNLGIRLSTRLNSLSEEAIQAKRSLVSLYEVVVSCAEQQEREDHLFSKRRKERMSEEEKKRRFGKNYDPQFRKRNRSDSRPDSQSRARDQSSDSRGKTKKPKRDYSNVECYKCQKTGHTVYRCPEVASKEEAREIIAKRKKKQMVASVQGSESTLVDCWVGTNALPTKELLDSGAYTCFLSAEIARESGLHVKSLSETRELPLAVKNKNATVVGSAVGNLILARPSDGRRLRIRNIRFLILEGARDFVIVGDDVLNSLGISPLKQLNKIAVDYQYMPPVEEVEMYFDDRMQINAINLSADRFTEHKKDIYEIGLSLGDAQKAMKRLETSLDAMIERSRSVFNSPRLYKSIHKLVYEFKDIWRVNLMDDLLFGNTDPIKVPPYDIRLTPDAIPRTARMRSYNRLERQFLRKMTQELTAINCLYRNFTSRWSSPSYVVTKPGKLGNSVEDFRWTGDIRYVNSVTQKLATCMPLMSTLLEYLSGSQFYASLDCHKGYWQIPLSKSSQEICSFLTPHGIFSPTRLMQGHTDSVAVFQQTMERIFSNILYKSLLIWIDDLLCYAETPEVLLDSLKIVFTKCREYNIRLSPEKTQLGLTEIKWCGRIISGSGIRYNPTMIQGLIDLKLPQTASELQHLLTASNWLRISLPNYAETVHELSLMLRKCQQEVGSLKKKKLSRKTLNWDEKALESFNSLKSLLSRSVQLSHFRHGPDYVLCLFTDASEFFWGITLTQVKKSDWERSPLGDQAHEPLAFLSGAFSGSHLNWPMVIKEGYPIITALERLRQYLSLKEFILYTDHRNLVYLFNHLPRANDVKKNVSQMIQRWHVKLLAFTYIIEHVPGTENVWADILSRFREETVPILAVVSYTSYDVISDPNFSELEVPTARDIPESKRDLHQSQSLIYDSTLVSPSVRITSENPNVHSESFRQCSSKSADGKIGISVGDLELDENTKADLRTSDVEDQFLMDIDLSKPSLVASITPGREPEDELNIITGGIKGTANLEYSKIIEEVQELKSDPFNRKLVENPELRVELMILAHCGLSGHRGIRATQDRLRQFYWKNMHKDIEVFCTKCIHCLLGRSHGLKTMLSSQMHAKKPNQMLHFDFLYMDKNEYLLVVKDDLSSFVELFVCENADHFAVVDSLMWWNARYGLNQGTVFISDQGSHFKNQVMEDMVRLLRVDHRFTPAHSPRSNGTVEVVNRIFLKLLRALRSEFHVNDWRDLVSFIQASLNSTPSAQLGGYSPMEVFTGKRPDSPITLLFDKGKDLLSNRILPENIAEMMSDLNEAMIKMHREVDYQKDKLRKLRRQSQNKKSVEVNYHEGDFVLLRLEQRKKKSFSRSIPYIVKKVLSPHLCVIQHLITGTTKEVHIQRLLPYTAKNVDLGLLKELVGFHTSFEVERILDIRISELTGLEEVLVKWRGFDNDSNSWEPIGNIQEDITQMLEDFRKRDASEKGSVEN